MENISKLKPLFLLFAILLFANTAKSITISSTLDSTPPSGGQNYTAVTGMQNGRVNLSGATNVSTCAVPKDYPGTLQPTVSRRYDAYTFTPTASQCVTLTYNSTDTTGNIQVVVYDEDGFNPVDISQNFLASSGTSTGVPGTAQSFSFNVTAGRPVTVVVSSVNVTTTPLGYTFTLNIPGAAVLGPKTSGALNLLDFTGDGRADYAVFRPTNNFWYINPTSSTSNLDFTGRAFGNAATDVLTPGDYDGDGKTDLAVWRATNGTFYVLRSSDNTFTGMQFGQNGDVPVARDYDGDGKTDFAVVRNSSGAAVWYILNSGSNNSFRAESFGTANDVLAPGDYDGDGKFDLAVFRGTGDQPATFYVRRSSGGDTSRQFGLASDLVVPGDYDGDRKTDYAVMRPGSAYQWYVLRSSDNSLYTVQLGAMPDLATQNDYDGDGKTDVSVYHQQTGTFYVIRSSDGALAQRQFGSNGDYPVANYDTH